MSDSKKKTKKATVVRKNQTSKTAPKKAVSGQTRRKEDDRKTAAAVRKEPADRAFHQVLPYLLGALAVFLLVCFLSEGLTGIIGVGLRGLFYGLFGGAAFAIPFLLLLLAIFWRRELRGGTLKFLVLYQALFLLFLSAMIHLWTGGTIGFRIADLWKNGHELAGGGVIGGLIGSGLHQLTGSVGTHIIGISGIVIFGLFMFGLTPYSIYVYIAYYFHQRKEKQPSVSDVQKTRRKYYFRTNRESDVEPSRVRRDPIDRHRFVPDIEVGEGSDAESVPKNGTAAKAERAASDAGAETPDDDLPPFDVDESTLEKIKPIEGKTKLTKRTDLFPGEQTEARQDTADLQGIFTDQSGVDVLQRFADEQKKKELEKQRRTGQTYEAETEIAVSRTPAVGGAEPEPVKKEYEFPPLSLLHLDTSTKNVDISEELHTNATRLVETLRSFKVPTRIVNVSRGPTITRYELAPEEGVRVRRIADLVDDIALNLATSGVRIEAPIPGKPAVGVEVPNKTVATIYLRDLLDTETFRKATSKLNVALGVDVAGDPVYLDIEKMPHLLIAGATGMGKSVCINCIISSLLYKASPEEVKLILVDPKKVEFRPYDGLPHLLVPVVTEPKKAAGALQWAVTEMERRFELIEEVGVRNLKMYNTVTKDDPEKEFLPQIVIIIDELADLMMTASSDVEESICRIAQKARAAGMHLIIGTQRPSVDVITGLIKSNVPSRIAFTVASQTDSRVVLDIGGAEKLIGRGDMLYAPVGAFKPRRVQGAFVSDSEVESIVSFIKQHNGDHAEYSSDIIASIDRAAAACGNGKKGASGGDDGMMDEGGDSMLRPAIELALETGKISTSLIQRRLSLGYGRAAKLIDEMEKRGIVSAPEGQKPRTVLITKQQYMEMVLNRSEELE